MLTRSHRGTLAFSFIEVILAMTILTMLVGISVVTYNENVEQSRHDMALQKLQYLSDAVQRWEMDQNTRYPYDNLQPLEGKYIRNLVADPWGGEYQIDASKGIVYSMGTDGRDDVGAGDDVTISFDTDRDPPPAAPTDFKAKRVGSNITLTWKDPTVNFDGSPINGDLAELRVYYRLSSSTDVTSLGILPISSGVQSTNFDFSTYIPQAAQETCYFYIRAYDFAGNEGPPSQPAGLFIVAKTAPVINLFQASPPRCPLQTPFSVKMDISDGDANLTRVTLSGTGLPDTGCGAGQFEWTTDAGPADQKLVNQFHPVLHYTIVPQTPYTSFTLSLSVADASGNTTSTNLPYKIEFTNDPPRLNTLSPGVHNVTINPSSNSAIVTNYAEITYLVEAGDGEANITELHLEATYDPDATIPGGSPFSSENYNTSLHKVWNSYGANGVPVAVESFTWHILPKKAQTVFVKAWAVDAQGETSIEKTATLNLSKDKTPPQYLSFWMDDSNPVISDEQFTRWWIKDRSGPPEGKPANYMEAYAWGWELESKPVTYYCCVSTTSPSDLTEFYSQAVTETTTTGSSKWVPFTQDPVTERGHIELEPNNGFQSGFSFDPTKRYYALVMAKNAVDVFSVNSAPPRHKNLKIEQNPFGYDDTPPEITEVTIDSLGTVAATSDVWFNGVLSATWKTRDHIIWQNDASGVGSGAKWWKYRIIREPTPGDTVGATYVYPDPPGTWETVDSPEIKDMAMKTDFPIARFICEFMARDAAGNWSPLVTAAARLDLTPPTTWVGVVPVVLSTSDDGFIHANNTIEASWAGVFYDNESGIESFDWGVSTTRPLDASFPIPNIVPWQRVDGVTFNQYFTRNDPPLLVDGTDVYVCVRARNYAGQVSETVYSTGYPVDVSMYTDLTAKPRSGYQAMSVEFSVSVTGGKAPFDYTMLFDGSYGNPARMWLETSNPASPYTTSFPYDIATFGAGRHSCVVKVRDADKVQSTMDIYFDLHTAPLFAIVLGKTGTNFEFYKFNGTALDPISLGGSNTLNLFTGAATGATPVAMDLGPNHNFFFVAGSGGGASIYRRWHLEGPRTTHFDQVDIKETAVMQNPRDIRISPDGSFALFAGEGQQKYFHFGWVARIMLYPNSGRKYGASPWSIGVFTDATDFSGLACEIWDGGFSACAAVHDSDFGGSNVRYGVCPVDLGFTNVLQLQTDRYFGTNGAGTEYRDIQAIKASPDNKWLAFTSAYSSSRQVFLAEAIQMSAGTGAMPCTSATVPGRYWTNPVWHFDSSRFYVASQNSGVVYFVDATTYPAASLTPMTNLDGGTAVFAGNAKRLDISPDSQYIALTGRTTNSVWIGTISGGSISWHVKHDCTSSIVDARFIQQPKYGGPWLSNVSTFNYTLGTNTWEIDLDGVGLWPNTRVTLENQSGDKLINNLSLTALGLTPDFDHVRISANPIPANDPTGTPHTIELRNTVGASVKTTSITFDP